MDLVEPESAQEAAILVAGIEVTHLREETVHGLHTPRRIEKEVPARKIHAFIVGKTQAEGHLAHLARRQV